MTERTPAPGALVTYVLSCADIAESGLPVEAIGEPRAAEITKVLEDGSVNLRVSLDHPGDGALFLVVEASIRTSAPTAGCWQWRDTPCAS